MSRLLVIFVLAGCSFAQIPDAPSASPTFKQKLIEPLKDPAFYIGVGNHAASAIVDVHSTQACESTKPPSCFEAYKGHDTYRYMVPLIALEAAAQYGCSLMLSEHKRWRWGCLGISAAMSFYHWKDVSTIYRNDLRARP